MSTLHNAWHANRSVVKERKKKKKPACKESRVRQSDVDFRRISTADREGQSLLPVSILSLRGRH